MFPDLSGYWYGVPDGNDQARALFNRHYSRRRYKDGRKPKLFVGPGEKTVLLTSDGLALFIWRKFKSDDHQYGINCAVFRNEGEVISSVLITEAMDIARRRWPLTRMYTYVDPKATKPKKHPGACFRYAGWWKCGTSKGGLVILEYDPIGAICREYGAGF